MSVFCIAREFYTLNVSDSRYSMCNSILYHCNQTEIALFLELFLDRVNLAAGRLADGLNQQ
jgi:hypothetical protein